MTDHENEQGSASWPTILLLSLLGIPGGVLVVLGWSMVTSYYLWLIMPALILTRLVAGGGRVFVAALAAGAVSALLMSAPVVLFWSHFEQNDPEYAALYGADAEGYDVRLYVALSTLFYAPLYGLYLAILSLVAKRFARRRILPMSP